MNPFEKFSISFSGNTYLLAAGIVFVLLYSVYIYRFTLPKINGFYKSILILLRTTALSALLLLMFDPVLKIKNKVKIEPVNLIFIDNSKSIASFANENEIAKTKNLAKELYSELKGTNKIFTFGKTVNAISVTKIDSLKFNETSTRFMPVFNETKKYENVASVIIISDGIVNEGKNPVYIAEQKNIPVYTVALGDTTTSNDIIAAEINSNRFIYPNRETAVEVIVKNTGLENKKATVKLLENKTQIGQKSIILSPTGINRIQFNYKAATSGEHKLTAIVASDVNEENRRNNIKSAMVNVLETKKKIVIISGSPSSDVSIIKSSLQNNEDFEIKSIVQTSKNKFYKDNYDKSITDSADVLLLINFPSFNTSAIQINKVHDEIKNNGKPFLICFSNNTDFTKLNLMKDILPFDISSVSEKFLTSQTGVSDYTNNLLGSSEQMKETWNNLPPVNITRTNITPEINSDILLESNTQHNLPIVFLNNINGNKSITINAANIWRWKLKAKNKELKLFDNFILNSVKWLTNKNDKERFKLKPNKKNYKLGETVLFTAEVYDETFEPVDNANIVLQISGNTEKQTYNFTQTSEGFYKCEIQINKPGLYKYSGSLILNNKNSKLLKGSFNVEPVELELIASKTDLSLLKTLSEQSGGKFAYISNAEKIIKPLNNGYEHNIIFRIKDNKLHLSSLDFILLLIVLIFSIEWILRKILRML